MDTMLILKDSLAFINLIYLHKSVYSQTIIKVEMCFIKKSFVPQNYNIVVKLHY